MQNRNSCCAKGQHSRKYFRKYFLRAPTKVSTTKNVLIKIKSKFCESWNPVPTGTIATMYWYGIFHAIEKGSSQIKEVCTGIFNKMNYKSLPLPRKARQPSWWCQHWPSCRPRCWICALHPGTQPQIISQTLSCFQLPFVFVIPEIRREKIIMQKTCVCVFTYINYHAGNSSTCSRRMTDSDPVIVTLFSSIQQWLFWCLLYCISTTYPLWMFTQSRMLKVFTTSNKDGLLHVLTVRTTGLHFPTHPQCVPI